MVQQVSTDVIYSLKSVTPVGSAMPSAVREELGRWNSDRSPDVASQSVDYEKGQDITIALTMVQISSTNNSLPCTLLWCSLARKAA
jgi:hypothetical protein